MMQSAVKFSLVDKDALQVIGRPETCVANASTLFTCHQDRSVEWSATPGPQPRRLFYHPGHNPHIACLKGSNLVTVANNGRATLWDCTEGICLMDVSLGLNIGACHCQLAGQLLACEVGSIDSESRKAAPRLALIDASCLMVDTEVCPVQIGVLLPNHNDENKHREDSGNLLNIALCKTITDSYIVGITEEAELFVWPLGSNSLSYQGSSSQGTIKSAKQPILIARFTGNGKSLVLMSPHCLHIFVSDDWLHGWSCLRSYDYGVIAEFQKASPQDIIIDKENLVSHGNQFLSKRASGPEPNQARPSKIAKLVGSVLLRTRDLPDDAALQHDYQALIWDDEGYGQMIEWSDEAFCPNMTTVSLSPLSSIPSGLIGELLCFHIKTLSPEPSTAIPDAIRSVGMWWQTHQSRSSKPFSENHPCFQTDTDLRASQELCKPCQCRHSLMPKQQSAILLPLTSRLFQVAQGCLDGTVGVQNISESIISGQECLFTLTKHSDAVSYLLEYALILPSQPSGHSSISFLLSGAFDGSFHACQLPFGPLHMKCHLHTSKILCISVPPGDTEYPWSTRVITLGEDGSAFLLDLEQGCCVAALRGCPSPLTHPSVHWSFKTGYITGSFDTGHSAIATTLSMRPSVHDSQGPILLVWDIQSGKLERVLIGEEAKSILEASNSSLPSDQRNMSNTLTCLAHISATIAPFFSIFITLDIKKALDQGVMHLDAVAAQRETTKGFLWFTRQILFSLLVLHRFGVVPDTDALLLQALCQVEMVSTDPYEGKTTQTLLLCDMLQGAGGNLTLIMDSSLGPGTVPSRERLAEKQVRILAFASLLEQAGGFLSDGLMGVLCTLAARITAQYTIQMTTLKPLEPRPSLFAIASASQADNEFIRASACMLLASIISCFLPIEDDCPSSILLLNTVYEIEGLSDRVTSLNECENIEVTSLLVVCAILLVEPDLVSVSNLEIFAPQLLTQISRTSQHQLLSAKLLRAGLESEHAMEWLSKCGGLATLLRRLQSFAENASPLPMKSSTSMPSPPPSITPKPLRSFQSNPTIRTDHFKAKLGPWHIVQTDNSGFLEDNIEGTVLHLLASAACLQPQTFLQVLRERAADHHRLLIPLLSFMAGFTIHRQILNGILYFLVPVLMHCLRVQAVSHAAMQKLIEEISVHCPSAAFSPSTNLVAVGQTEDSQQIRRHVLEPIPVYELRSGQQKFLLHFRSKDNGAKQSLNSNIAAMSFDPGGQFLCAISPVEGKLRVWPLGGGFKSQRPTECLCIKVFNLNISPEVRLKKGSPDLAWQLKWSDAGIAIYHDSMLLGLAKI